MADHSSAQISDNSSTAAADSAAHPDAALLALFEKRIAVRTLTREADDDDADAAYDEMDRIDALIVSTAAHTLAGIRLKANICRDIADGDAELAWPMLSSLMADLQRAGLDDQAMLRSIFAELAVPLPPRQTPRL
jgi:hypothetical protein